MTTIILFIAAFCILAALMMALFNQPNKNASVKSEPPKVEMQKPQESPRPPLTDAEREAIRQADEAWDWKTHNAIVEGTYTGPLPEHLVGGYWTQLYPDIYSTSVAGINFRKGIKNLAGITFDATLVADPKNKHDKKAIKIISFDGRHLGFIPADETDAVREFLSGSLPYPCRVHVDENEQEEYSENSGRFYTRHYLIGRINIYRNKSTEQK